MADETETQAPAAAPVQAPAPAAQVAVPQGVIGIAPAPTPDLDTTVEGGRYIVNGITVNANGEAIDTKAKK